MTRRLKFERDFDSCMLHAVCWVHPARTECWTPADSLQERCTFSSAAQHMSSLLCTSCTRTFDLDTEKLASMLCRASMAGPHADYAAQHPDRVYLSTPFSEKDTAKNLGARWDPQCPRSNASGTPNGMWYVPPHLTNNLAPFRRWLQGSSSTGASASAAEPAMNEHGYEPFEAFRERYAADAIRQLEAQGKGMGWCFTEQIHGQCPFQCHSREPCKWRHTTPDHMCDNYNAQRMRR